ncbi:MAG: hypothetical protein L6Q35_14760, partial [Phycisphaerales bacterium]|nr:hypothetical protein [Phycisphaerales bacterium]
MASSMKSGDSSASSSETAGGLSATWEPLAKALWETLTHDVTAEVVVMTSQGKIVFANRDAEMFARVDPNALVGT